MNSGGFDINSLTRNSPGDASTPPSFPLHSLPVGGGSAAPGPGPGAPLPGGGGGGAGVLPPGGPVGGPFGGGAMVAGPGGAALQQPNSLASSVNLSSIQSLIDLLVELPLPSETSGQVTKQQMLLTLNQQQQHVGQNLHQELGHLHNLSHQLAHPLRNAKQELNQMNINWSSSYQANQGNQFSLHQETNSYLLSLLKQQDALFSHVILPPITHQAPVSLSPLAPPLPPPPPPLPVASATAITPLLQAPQGPQTRSASHSSWHPWSTEQPPPQQPLNASFVASNASPVAMAPHSHQQQQQAQQQAFRQNPLYSNENSNSSSSFSEQGSVPPGTPTTTGALPAALGTPSTLPYTHPPKRFPCPEPPISQPPIQQLSRQQPVNPTPAPLPPGAAPHHQPLVKVHHQQGDLKPDIKGYNHNLVKEAVIVLNKIDKIDDMIPVHGVNHGFSPGDFAPYSSLGDRVKSNKRQRNHSAVSGGSKREKRESGEKGSSSSISKKSSKSGSPSKANSSSAFSSLSSYPSTTLPQLSSQTAALPAPEKFEAMLDELFDLGKGRKTVVKSSDDDSDDSDDEIGRKKKSKKTNGEAPPNESKAALFDISLSGHTLAHFVGLSAKLKRSNQMQSVSVSKLTNLLTVLTQQLAIQSAGLKDKRRRSSEGGPPDEEDDEDDNITTSASLMAKFECCCDCCVVALYALTSKGMSSRVYLEECIEQIVAFLNTTILQFTVIGSCSSGAFASPSKKKSPKKMNSYISPTTGANKKILQKMYTKWSELIALLVELLTLRSGALTDTLVLSSTRLALGAFFLENLSTTTTSLTSSGGQSNEIQLNALKLTTTIFSQYNNHRGVILEELLHSIARLPTSKRGRVIYKVDGEEGSSGSISMFSALLQQLIQSLFTPKETSKQDSDKSSDNSSKGKDKEGASKESSRDKRDNSAHGSRLRPCHDPNMQQWLKHAYDAALRTSYTFLSTFLRKCCGLAVGSGGSLSSSDCDYRVLFEGLVSDLMVTLHKPNWPAAQILTQVLIKLLIQNITAVSVKGSGPAPKGPGGGGGASAQLNLKLASLDHLGTIVSRYAKELSDIEKVKSEVKTSLNSIVNGDVPKSSRLVNHEEGANDEASAEDKSPKKKSKAKARSRKGSKDSSDGDLIEWEIWKHLLRYCDEEKLVEEKNLFVSIWLRDMEREAENQQQTQELENGAVSASPQEQWEAKVKQFMVLYSNAANPNAEEEEYHVIDTRTAELIIKYADVSQTTTVRLFDSALGHIIATLSTTSNTTMRSRAMKSLSTILNNAPKQYATTLLSRVDLQRATKTALLDPSTSVREATIDLIGKFMLNGQSEELIDKYYDIITERILDAGVSVRKRVIKILREICLTYPTYKRVPEICSKIIKRINDDGEGIRKLVTETFTSMWFKEEKDREAIKIKVNCINHVVATVLTERIGTEWLQQLLTNLFLSTNNANAKKTVAEEDEDEGKVTATAQQVKEVTTASAQIIDVLVADILCGEVRAEGQPPDQQQQKKSTCVSAMTTIWLFGKVCPQLLVNHISTLQPYLSMKVATQLDIMIMVKVVQIIEHVLPKLANPSEILLTRIEEDLTKNILQNNAHVLGVCVSCLSSLIHRHTKNNQLAQDLFRKFFHVLDTLVKYPNMLEQPVNRPRLLRSLFTCGLFAKHFEFLQEKQQLFEYFVKFVLENRVVDGENCKDLDILLKALTGLGFMFERNPAFSLKPQTQDIYRSILNAALVDPSVKRFDENPGSTPSSVSAPSSSSNLQAYQEATICQILKNLTNYLSDEFTNELTNQIEWSREDLKSMVSEDGDSNSIQSSIIQCYLPDVLKCTLSPLLSVRRAGVNLIHIIHNGGHVHPLQLVPYLIAMSSDDDVNIRFRADHVLNEIERKYHGFVSMKSKVGVQLAYQLHSHSSRRGYRIESVIQGMGSSGQQTTLPSASATGHPSSSGSGVLEHDKLVTGRLSTLYSVVSGNRQSRRAFVGGLLKYFDMIAGTTNLLNNNDVMMGPMSFNVTDDNDPGPIQQFVCDNLLWLPYGLWDEPLYLLHQLELAISLLASHTQSQFKEVLNLQDDDDDELEAEASKKKEARERNGNPETSEPKAALDPETGAGDTPQANQEDNGLTTNSSHSDFNASLSSYLPQYMPSILSVVELVKSLRAFYMLSWSKQLMKELFNVSDAKFQDYSPNENQKVWDKQVHRKHVDLRIIDKLMNYPKPLVDPEKFDNRDNLLEEYQRFKNLQLTGFDSTTKTVAQILKEPLPKHQQSQSHQHQHQHQRNDHQNHTQQQEMSAFNESIALPNLSKESEEELLQRIRASECSVSLVDISSLDISNLTRDPPTVDQTTGGQPSQGTGRLKMTISTSSFNSGVGTGTATGTGSGPIPVKKKKKKKEKKRKKHKKHKFRMTSDDENDSESDSENDDDDEDPNYC